MSNKKPRKKRKKSGSLKAFFLSILISLLLILAVAAIILFVLYPENIMTNELLYDICMKLVQFFSIVFVLSVASIWINFKPLREVNEEEILPQDFKCRYSSAMLNPKPFDKDSDESLEKSHPLGKLNDYWEAVEEGFLDEKADEYLSQAEPYEFTGTLSDNAQEDSDEVGENDDFVDINDFDGVIVTDEFNYSYAFRKPEAARGVILPVRKYIPFKEKVVKPFPYFEDGAIVDRHTFVSSDANDFDLDYASASTSPVAAGAEPQADDDEELVLRAFDDDYSQESLFDEEEKEERIEDNDELSLPLSDVLPANDGFEDILHYVQPIFNVIPFIQYEDLILDEKVVNPRPLGIGPKGLVPFKYIHERVEVQEEAVSLGFVPPKQPEPQAAPTFNFSINSNDGDLRGRSGNVVPFEFYKDLLDSEIELTYRDDSVKSTGVIKFTLYGSDKEDNGERQTLGLFNPETQKSNQFTEENIMDNFIAPENIFSYSKTEEPSTFDSSNKTDGDILLYSKAKIEKWWEDFEFIPGKAKEEKSPSSFTPASLAPINVSSDDSEIQKIQKSIVPFVYYEDLLSNVIIVNRREDSVQSTGLVPFKYLEKKELNEEGIQSGFAPTTSAYSKQEAENSSSYSNSPSAQSAEQTDSVPSQLDFQDKTDNVSSISHSDVVRIPSDNPNNPYYNLLCDIDDVKSISSQSASAITPNNVSGFANFANTADESKKEKWWEDFEYTQGALKDNKFTEKWWEDFEFIPGKAKEEDVGPLNYNISSEDGNLRGRQYNAVPFAYYEDLLVDEYEINDRSDDISPEGLVPFDLLGYVSENDNSPSTFAPSSSSQVSRLENPNNLSYAKMLFAGDIESGNRQSIRIQSPNVAGFDAFNTNFPRGVDDKWWEDFEYTQGALKDNKFTEKWWEDFEFIPGEAKEQEEEQEEQAIEAENAAEQTPAISPLKQEVEDNKADDIGEIEDNKPDVGEVEPKNTLSNLLDKYYAQMFALDEWDYYKSNFLQDIKEKDNAETKDEYKGPLEKWWEDFVFVPGKAKEKPEVQEDATSEIHPRIISLIEEEMASSLDIDYPLTIAKIESDKIDEIFALDWVDIVAFRIDKKSACLVFIALDKKESIDVINTIKDSVDKNIKYKISELAGRKIDKRSFLAEISA